MIVVAIALVAALCLFVAAITYDEWRLGRVGQRGGDAGRPPPSAGTGWLAAHEADVRRRQLEALEAHHE